VLYGPGYYERLGRDLSDRDVQDAYPGSTIVDITRCRDGLMQNRFMSRFLALIAVALLLTSCGAPSDEEVRSKCPSIARKAMTNDLGKPILFEVTKTANTGTTVEGTAAIKSRNVTWSCAQGIAKRGTVQIDVLDAKTHATVITDFVDVH
jgi:hypothetical protein